MEIDKKYVNLVDKFLKLSAKSIILVVQDSESRVWNSTQQQVYAVDSLSISMPFSPANLPKIVLITISTTSTLKVTITQLPSNPKRGLQMWQNETNFKK